MRKVQSRWPWLIVVLVVAAAAWWLLRPRLLAPAIGEGPPATAAAPAAGPARPDAAVPAPPPLSLWSVRLLPSLFARRSVHW